MVRAKLAGEPDAFQPTDDLVALDDVVITLNDDHCSSVNQRHRTGPACRFLHSGTQDRELRLTFQNPPTHAGDGNSPIPDN